MALILLAFAGLLVRDHSRWLPRPVYPILFALPILLASAKREWAALRLWAAYVIAFVAFSLLRRVADDTGLGPFSAYVIAADRLLGFGTLPTHALQATLPLGGAALAAAIGVHLSYYVTPPVVGLICWRRAPDLFPRYVLSLVGIFLLSIVLHFALPTVPPWLAAIQGDVAPVRRLVAEALEGWNPAFYAYGTYVAAGNDVAAMPSVHTAAVMVIALAAWTTRWRWVALTYVACMGLALVYLGEHYAADVLAGAAVAIAIWRWCPSGPCRWRLRLHVGQEARPIRVLLSRDP